MPHKRKDKFELAYDADVKRLRLEGRILLDNIYNEVLSLHAEEFLAAKTAGEILKIGSTTEELRSYMTRLATPMLEEGS